MVAGVEVGAVVVVAVAVEAAGTTNGEGAAIRNNNSEGSRGREKQLKSDSFH